MISDPETPSSDAPLRLQSQSYIGLWVIGAAAIAAMCVALVAAIFLTHAESTRGDEPAESSTPGTDDDKTVYIELNLDSSVPTATPSNAPARP